MGMTMRKSDIFALLVIAFTAPVTPVVAADVAVDNNFEKPAGIQAGDVLPPEMLSGDHFHVLPDVQNDGFMNFYEVESDYGKFTAYGNLALLRLIREIGALADLDEVSKTKVFLKSAAEAGTQQLKTLKHVAAHPVQTVTGLPDGIVRTFHHSSVMLKRTTTRPYMSAGRRSTPWFLVMIPMTRRLPMSPARD